MVEMIKMESKEKILNIVKILGSTVLGIGIIMFLLGVFASGFSILTSIGIGTVMGAVFIFLIGVFFVATEEMLSKTTKGHQIIPHGAKKGTTVYK
jgi:membrane protein CcdC involved in cytochrome C biogenesis